MRLICIAMDEGKCVLCGKYDPSNDAHHLFYRDSWKKTKPEDLLTLCRDCHTRVHDLGADVTARKLWQKYKHLEPKLTTGCYICGYDLPSQRIKVNKEKDTYLDFCGECWIKVRVVYREVGHNPWVGIRKIKDEFYARRRRRFYISILLKMVEIGLEKKTEIDLFHLAILKAGKKIRNYLLTWYPLLD